MKLNFTFCYFLENLSNGVLYLLDSERLLELSLEFFGVFYFLQVYIFFIFTYVRTSICLVLVNMAPCVFLVSFLNLEIGNRCLHFGPYVMSCFRLEQCMGFRLSHLYALQRGRMEGSNFKLKVLAISHSNRSRIRK